MHIAIAERQLAAPSWRRGAFALLVGVIASGAINMIAPRRSAYAATGGRQITMEAERSGTFPESYDVADRLDPGTVLAIHATGFASYAPAIAKQCASNGFCGNEIPVQFDADGEARFQYLVDNEFLVNQHVRGGCRAGAAPCTLVLRASNSATRSEIQTIFVDAIAPPGRITVTPSSGLALAGETVKVEVHDYPAGVTVHAMLCAAPDASGPRCGAPGPTASLLVGRDGSGRTNLKVAPGVVGARREECFRGDDCGISVASDEVFARAPVVPISFAAPPGAAYDGSRVAFGLLVALLLIVIATWLIVRGDWSAVGEAAAPEIDDAEYADLDAIIAALPPEHEELVAR